MTETMINRKIVETVRNADIITFLERRYGFAFAHQRGAYRCKEHPSLAVKSDRRSFYWHSKGFGGHGVLDYLIKVEGTQFREAVAIAIGLSPTAIAIPPATEPPKPKTLMLPPKTSIPLRLYGYLCNKRGIDSDIVNTLMQKEQLYEDKRGNVVFVGHDEQGKARFASLRGTHGDCTFRGDCLGSDKRYGFCMAADTLSKRLYIFESAIDLMSHASLENTDTGDKSAWLRDNRLSLAGATDTAIPFFLNQHKHVRELVFCLDNDRAGREATANMARKYADKGYITRLELPMGKDFNEDLQAHKQQIQAEKRTKTLHKSIAID